MSVADTTGIPPRLARQVPAQRSVRPHVGMLGRLRGFASLVRIGFLRSWGWVVITLMVLVGAVFVRQELVPGVVLWSDLSTTVGATTMFLGPLAMGYTAWRAQSTRQARMVELEAASPMSPLTRDLGRILSSTLVVVVGQVMLVALALVYGARMATWGGPLSWPLALGIATIFTAGLIGGVVGTLAPWRMAPPLLALLTLSSFLAVESQMFGFQSQMFGRQRSNSLQMFSPFAVAERETVDPFWNGGADGLADIFTLLMVLAGLSALALFAFARRRTVVTWLLAALLCGSTAFAGAVHRDHWSDFHRTGITLNDPRPFTYTCEPWKDGEICVHPAYASLIDDLGSEADRVLAPVAGLPGVPTTIRHMTDDVSDDGKTIWTSLRSLSDDWKQRYGNTIIRQAIGLVYATEAFSNFREFGPSQPDAAQMVIGRWLSSEAGLDPQWLFGPVPPTDMGGEGEFWFAGEPGPVPAWATEIEAAVERFSGLSQEEQRAWLESNWDALRAGDLTLEDLP